MRSGIINALYPCALLCSNTLELYGDSERAVMGPNVSDMGHSLGQHDQAGLMRFMWDVADH